jgi:hypothetical protein
MKKVILVALMLTLITSVAWAKEIALSADTAVHSAAPGDNPGTVPVPPKGEHNTGEVLFWDDGIMDDYWQDTYTRAVQFTAPVDCHVTQSMVYLYEEVFSLFPYYFAIYDDNGGVPGTEIGGMLTIGGVFDAWHETDVTPVGITLSAGEVFYAVVVKQNDTHPYFCSDTTEPIHGHFYNDGTDWVADALSNCMIRLVVDDDVAGPYTNNPNPGPGESGVHGDTAVTFEILDSDHEVSLKAIIVVIDGADVTDDCAYAMLPGGGCLVTFKPEKEFNPGDVYVYWSAEDELGNGAEDTWYFTVEENADDANTEDTTWGVIKEKF